MRKSPTGCCIIIKKNITSKTVWYQHINNKKAKKENSKVKTCIYMRIQYITKKTQLTPKRIIIQ